MRWSMLVIKSGISDHSPQSAWRIWYLMTTSIARWNEALISALSVSWRLISTHTSGVHLLTRWFSSSYSGAKPEKIDQA